jgi:hypothetical protein
MGFRTVVILYNDQCSEWEKDETLGKKIAIGMNYAIASKVDPYSPAHLGYGYVAQCAHADTQTVAVLDSYHMTTLINSYWKSGEKTEDRNLRLVKEMANQLGYRLVKKSEK